MDASGLKYFLLANPGSKDANLGGKLNDDMFYSNYFVKLPTYERLNTMMENALPRAPYSFPTTIFLYGYSGIGKTTYLKWYSRNYITNFNKVYFDLTNLSVIDKYSCEQNKRQHIHGIKLFYDLFNGHLRKIFGKNKLIFDKLLKDLKVNGLNITGTLSSKFFEALDEYVMTCGGTSDKATGFMKLLSNCTYGELFALLLLFYFYYPTEFCKHFGIEFNSDLPLLMIFDNIDHVEIESQNSKFPNHIQSIYLSLLEDLQDFLGKPETDEKVHFIFCLRDANCSLINCQHDETRNQIKIEFIPADESRIFAKRFRIAREHGLILTVEQKAFINFFFHDRYTKRSIYPLFNYNLRKLAKLASYILEETNSTYINDIQDVNSKKYIEILGDYQRYCSRGIEYYLIIRYLRDNDYLKNHNLYLEDIAFNTISRGPDINPVRILLTNILNRSRYSLSTDLEKPMTKSYPIDLYNLFISFNEVFEGNIDLFFEVLTKIFKFHTGNWCHLITFSNKAVFNIDDFKEEILAFKKMIEYPDDETYKRKSDSLLENISVQLNPAGYVYVRDIAKHYEFFSVRNNNFKPLVCSKNIIYNKNGISFEFIDNIKNTYDLVEECITHLFRFLKNYSQGDYSYSSNCFRFYHEDDRLHGDNEVSGKSSFVDNDNKSPGLHCVRILDSHIGYIDAFRVLILNDDKFSADLKDELDKHQRYDFSEVKRKINENLIYWLEMYISLLREVTRMKSCEASGRYSSRLIKLFEMNITTIKNSNYADFSTLINRGRNEEFK